MKHDVSRFPVLTPESARGAPSAGPVRFSVTDAPDRERPGIYRDFFGRSVMGIDVEPMRDATFDADVVLQSLPGLQLFSGHVYGSRNRRTPELLADGRDEFTLFVNLGGPYLISQCDRELLLADGEATLVSTADPCSFMHHPPGGVLALRFPRLQLTPLASGLEDCCLRPIRRDTVALQLLTRYVQVGWEERTIASGDVQRLFVTHVGDLMAHALGATRDGEHMAQRRGLSAARLHALKQDIGQRLDQADLSVGELARRHGCTPRLVQRLFEQEGETFTEYVLAQRLARAYRLLGDPRRQGEKISAVAYDCGFGDVSYFNRMFRRRYGVAPSDVRAQALREPMSH